MKKHSLGQNKVLKKKSLGARPDRNAVVKLSTQPNGFSLDQLTTIVRARSNWSTDQYSTRNAAYDLAKLRGKMLVHRIKHSRRYRVAPLESVPCALILCCETKPSNRYSSVWFDLPNATRGTASYL
jgi:hypothetical protein